MTSLSSQGTNSQAVFYLNDYRFGAVTSMYNNTAYSFPVTNAHLKAGVNRLRILNNNPTQSSGRNSYSLRTCPR